MRKINGAIYKCTNLVTGKIYIGQTKEFNKRKSSHKYFSEHGYPGKLNTSIRKYGWENHDWCILEYGITNQKILDEREQYWISEYRSNIDGLNISPGGHKLSEEGLHNVRLKNSMKRANLTEDIVSNIKENLANGLGVIKVCRKFNLPYTTIREIKACNIWAWVREDLNDSIIKKTKKVHRRVIPHRGVRQHDPISMKVIKTFETLHEAQKATGVFSTNISKCCRGVSGFVTAGGYRWTYRF